MTSRIRRRSFLLSGTIAAFPALAAFAELKAREQKPRPGYRVPLVAEEERQQARRRSQTRPGDVPFVGRLLPKETCSPREVRR